MNADIFFFGDLEKEQSKKKLEERFQNARDDFKRYLEIHHHDDHEKCLEFIKLMTLVFIPDKVVCCIRKRDGEILAVNMVKEVYRKITEGTNNGERPKKLPLEELGVPIEKIFGKSNRFEHLQSFFRVNVNQTIAVEFITPYEIKTNFNNVIIKHFKKNISNSRSIGKKFFSQLLQNETINRQLQYFKMPEVLKRKEMDIKELFPYLEKMLSKIEDDIRKIMSEVTYQAWIYQYFQHDEYTKSTFGKSWEFIPEPSGFYVSVITGKKNKTYWNDFKKYANDKETVFKRIKEKMVGEFQVKDENAESDVDIKNFREKFYREIMRDENFPSYKYPDGRVRDESTKASSFKDLFNDELKYVFDFYWEQKTKEFFQGSTTGFASLTRDTQLPVFMNYFYKKDRKGTYDKSQADTAGTNEAGESDNNTDMTDTTIFLFQPEVFSEYTAFPIIINKAYWGGILIFFDMPGEASEKEEPEKHYDKIYQCHREIIKSLKKEILNYAESGILADFDNFVRKYALKAKDRKDFQWRIKLIEREAGKNPLIPNMYVFYFDTPCQCELTTNEQTTFSKKDNSIVKLSQCRELNRNPDLDYNRWEFALLYPFRVFDDKYPGKQVKGVLKKSCTIFWHTRALKNFPSNLDLSCRKIANYIEEGWVSVLTEEDKQNEKQNLYIRNAAVTIMLDTFSHNIAAHSMRYLLNFLEEREKKHLKIWENLDNSSPEIKDIGNILEVNSDNEWAELPIGVRRYIDFLREKSTFWIGAISEIYTSWGTTLSLYQVMKTFVENYLYIGSIAYDLGIKGVEFFIGINDNPLERWGKASLCQYDYPKIKRLQYSKCKKTWYFTNPKPGGIDIEEQLLYFPGGLVGLHSFYTILENTIRNAKFVDFDEEIIPLNLFIQKKENLYKILVGIDRQSKNEKNIHEVKKLLEQPIIDKDSKVQKGGILQIKISAAMLRGYELNIFSDSLKKTDPKLIDVDSELFEKEKKIFWEFYIWKACVYELFSDKFLEEVKKGTENPLRFKFLLIPPGEHNKFKTTATNNFPIRIIYLDSLNQNYSEHELYSQWLNEWTKDEKLKFIYKPASGKDSCKYWNENGKDQLEFSFFHSGSEPGRYANSISDGLIGTRSNGIFEEQFFEKQAFIFKEEKFPELVETIYTSVYIMDNELFYLWKKICKRFGKEPDEMENYSWNTSRLSIFKEVKIESEFWQKVGRNGEKHILIVHLSMIDILFDRKPESRNQFIKKALKTFRCIVLTTGRGREDAYAELDKENKIKSRFIYRNQFEKAFESALEVRGEEMFILKYLLVKALLGG